MTDSDVDDLARILADSRVTLAALQSSILQASAVVVALGDIAREGNQAHAAAPATIGRILAGMRPRYEAHAKLLEPAAEAFGRDMATLADQNRRILDVIYRRRDIAAGADDYLRSLIRLGQQAREGFRLSATLPDSIDALGRVAPSLGPSTSRLSAALRRLPVVAEPIYGWADRAEAILAGDWT